MSKFKSKYDDDPEFREAHLAYIKEKVKCSGCGKSVTRCNMTRHKRSNLHKKNLIYIIDISELEIYKKEINRKYNKKMRAIERERERELEIVNNKIKKALVDD
jgi:hypothetical protein